MKLQRLFAEEGVPGSTGVSQGLQSSNGVTGRTPVPNLMGHPIPSRLPLDYQDPNMLSAGPRAMGEAAETLVRVAGSAVGNIQRALLEKRIEEDKMQALRLYLGASNEMDSVDAAARQDTSLTKDGYDPYFERVTGQSDEIVKKALEGATEGQRLFLEPKLLAMQIELRGKAHLHSNARFVNRQEEMALLTAKEFSAKALGQDFGEQGQQNFQRAITEGAQMIDSLRALPADKRTLLRERFVQTAWGDRAKADMALDPAGFPDRSKQYEGKVDPTYLTTLRTQSYDEAWKRKEHAYTEAERARKVQEKANGDAALFGFRSLVRRMDPVLGGTATMNDQQRAPVTLTELDEFTRKHYQHLKNEEVKLLYDLYKNPIEEGGRSSPSLIRDAELSIMTGEMDRSAILGLRGRGASTKDVTALLKLEEETQSKRNIYSSPEFSVGRAQIFTRLTGLPSASGILGDILGALAPQDRDNVADAWHAYAKRAAGVRFEERQKLIDIALDIAKQFKREAPSLKPPTPSK